MISHELDVSPLILGGCARDELYARILVRARWFHARGDTANDFDYRVPGQWQGSYSRLRVIGDKRGGAVTRCIASHPDFLERVRDLVHVPLRLVHVVRNPFDNIATISVAQELSLEQAVDFYFRHVQTLAELPARTHAGELMTLRHEDVIREPKRRLGSLLAGLGLTGSAEYLEACSRIVFPRPTSSRLRIEWPRSIRRDVERRLPRYDFLEGYAFEPSSAETREPIAEGVHPPAEDRPRGAHPLDDGSTSRASERTGRLDRSGTMGSGDMDSRAL